MLGVPIVNSFGWSFQNQTNGSTVLGTSVVPGASNAEGSWTQIASSANIASDVDYVAVCVSVGSVNSTIKAHLLDFGWDPAGGTAYVAWMSNLVCGESSGFIAGAADAAGGRWFHFPCCIPAGSSVAVRVQGLAATAGTVRVFARFHGKPSRPEMWRSAAYSETVGTITNSSGVAFTPGNAAMGTWASLGTTVKPLWWWQLGFQVDDTNWSQFAVRLQLGVGDGTNLDVIVDTFAAGGGPESIHSPLQYPCVWEVPAGSTMYVRGNASGAPETNFNAVAVGWGG